MWRPNSGSGLQPLQRRLESLRHFSGIPTQPELLTTLTCFKGRTLCHCEERKRRSNLDRKDCFASLAMTRSHLWGVATILANTFFRECTHSGCVGMAETLRRLETLRNSLRNSGWKPLPVRPRARRSHPRKRVTAKLH